jgi:hypothetical protein
MIGKYQIIALQMNDAPPAFLQIALSRFNAALGLSGCTFKGYWYDSAP